MRALFHVGIDTSNYTTSAAAVTAAGEVLFAKRVLPVPPNGLGLRQSDALFSHTRALPEIVGDLCRQMDGAAPERKVLSVGASSRPRKQKGSYMPCFLAGVSAASAAAGLAGAPLYLFSHQEGHIESARRGAALAGKPFPEAKEFFALHLSGGTGEILWVRETPDGYDAEILASTLDITAGQLIDRCGVALGFSFPAGAELEACAKQSRKTYRIRPAVGEKGVSLSGFENQFRTLLEQGEAREDVARFVFTAVLESVRALLGFIPEDKRRLPVLFSGGVISSEILKDALRAENRYFAPPVYSADNAIGIAYLAKRVREANDGT